uniref:Uncharacterized protein n=1 Tax=Meloidogyne hapla TaxID=6305 RepID=A0A1I8BL32_MELHA
MTSKSKYSNYLLEQWDEKGEKTKMIDKLIIQSICTDMRPFSFVEDHGILLGVEPPHPFHRGPPGVRPGFISGTVFTTDAEAPSIAHRGAHRSHLQQQSSSGACSETEFRCDDAHPGCKAEQWQCEIFISLH